MSNMFYIKLENDNASNTYIAKDLNEAILKFLSELTSQ